MYSTTLCVQYYRKLKSFNAPNHEQEDILINLLWENLGQFDQFKERTKNTHKIINSTD